MDVTKAISSIRVVRRFSAQRIPDADLEQILNAGRHAGSSKNQQRWRFVVVRDRERLRQLSQVGNFAQHLAGANLAIAMTTPDPHAPEAPLSIAFDLGRAAQNMVLMAWALGIGSCPATVYLQDQAKSILELPQDWHCEYVFSFGYPADPEMLTAPSRAGGRLGFEAVVNWERWSAGTD